MLIPSLRCQKLVDAVVLDEAEEDPEAVVALVEAQRTRKKNGMSTYLLNLFVHFIDHQSQAACH